jgi:hypothetical protein
MRLKNVDSEDSQFIIQRQISVKTTVHTPLKILKAQADIIGQICRMVGINVLIRHSTFRIVILVAVKHTIQSTKRIPFLLYTKFNQGASDNN